MQQRTLEAAPEPAPEARRPVRTIGRRVGLPSSRALLGAFLVTVAVVGLFVSFRRSQDDPTSPYVVVATTVPAGQVITEDDLAIRRLDLGELADRTFTAEAEAVGAVAVQTLLPGQLLQHGTVLHPAPGQDPAAPATFEVSFSIDRARALGGRLQPGELVDVVATLDVDASPPGRQRCTTVVAAGARVVGAGAVDDEILTGGGAYTVTVAVPEDQAVLGLVFAVDQSEVTIVRATRAQDLRSAGSYCGAGAGAATGGGG